ncbi:MAG: TonB family protein [Candidatus Eremiobacteraeota bacterium]|nr:TonB family protein [Candidatus Eremiobacteraeota bacterium]MBV9646189.1 TonB family protein [Candidatus Eremiobacteraeota bacterium]
MAARRSVFVAGMSCAAAFALCSGFVGAQGTTPRATDLRTTVACTVQVRDIIALDGTSYGNARTYAVYFGSLEEATLRTYGVVSIFAGEDRYDVPFRDLVVGGAAYAQDATPLVVRFAGDVHVDSGSVAGIGAMNGRTCAPVRRDATWLYGTASPRTGDIATLYKRAIGVAPIPAPAPAHVAASPCTEAYRAASARRLVPPNLTAPGVQVGFSEGIFPATVTIEVKLADDGTVLRARVVRSSDFAPYDAAAIDAARRSMFAPEMMRCRAHGGTYAFEVTFAPPSR